MDFSEFIGVVVKSIREEDLPYLVTGSLASTAYSEARTTRDIDVVVNAPFQSLQKLRDSLVDQGFIVPSVHRGDDMFNAVDAGGRWKADIISWQDEPFEKERFSRRVKFELVPGVVADVATVEDMILAKLRWIKGRDSAFQIWDVESMVELNRDNLDVLYLEKWSDELGTRQQLDEILAKYPPSGS